MIARIGDLGIARFDSDVKGQKYEKHVCLVIERCDREEFKFVWWTKHGAGTTMITSTLPKHRVVRARGKGAIGQLKIGSGELFRVTLDDVVPV